MESLKVSEALHATLNTSAYQRKLLIALSLSLFSFSSYVLGVPFLLCDDPSSSNITNDFILINKEFPVRAHIKYSCFSMIPVGSFFYSYLSDLLGRQKLITYLLMWNVVFRVFASISLTTNVLVLCSFFLGSFSLAGAVSCFLYIGESAPRYTKAFTAAVLITSFYFCLFLTCAIFYFQINWRMIIGFDIILASIALYLINQSFESVEWNFSKHGSLKTEVIITKIAAVNQLFDQSIDLDENNEEDYIKICINPRFLLLFAEWINFGLIFSMTIQETIEDLYKDKLIFALISLFSLSIIILQPELALKLAQLTMILSRISLITLQLKLLPKSIWHILQFLIPIELLALLVRSDEINPKRRAFMYSFLISSSFLLSELLTSRLSSRPLTLIPILLTLIVCSFMQRK